MINFLLEKVIRCAQMSVDCLMASKLVTLGYIQNILNKTLLEHSGIYSLIKNDMITNQKTLMYSKRMFNSG